MPFARTVPRDLETRLAGLGQVIADAVPGVDFACLFGSTATGRRRPESDVDVAIHLAGDTDTPPPAST